MTAKPKSFTFQALAAVASAFLFVFPALGQEENDCQECHSAEAASVPEQYQVSTAEWEGSLHFEMGIECLSCHTGPEGSAHEGADPLASCGDCHPDAVEQFGTSIHSTVSCEPCGGKMTCAACHGSMHSLVIDTDESSPMHPKNVAETCGNCHANPDLARRGGIRVVQPLAAYKSSVHGRAVEIGEHAATCSECHNATVVSYGRAVKLAVPSVHLPLVRRAYPSWMRCPACVERHWVKISFH